MEAPVLDRHSASPEPDPRGRPTRERRALRRIMRRLRIPIALYVGIVAVFFAIQTSLIFPGSETQGKPSSVVRPAPGTQLVSLGILAELVTSYNIRAEDTYSIAETLNAPDNVSED